MLQLTSQAIEALRTQEIPTGSLLRFDAELSGGCSTLVQFFLRIDEGRQGDTTIQVEDLSIVVDPFTQRYLDNNTVLDYTIEEGYILRSDEEIWAEGIPFLAQGEVLTKGRSC
ncbi:iron-sulfur cluster biosynthesis family protein [Rubeoparvulum massiliense]|uniref:iron-sulfur cluster biosynthesis family protein n=1 Tax=Rubeoparvulum massiliense TaxID=1631346 RepID=UPI00065E2423|nr:iron-sulfur cluster biosynthesis family protein [Rubeoparvulum massiliense]